jgi:hypothetical protein
MPHEIIIVKKRNPPVRFTSLYFQLASPAGTVALFPFDFFLKMKKTSGLHFGSS